MSTTTMNTTDTAASTAAFTPAALADLTGRVGLAAIFLLSGLNKIGAYEGTQAYMASAGVPGLLLPAVIVREVIGAVLLIAGFQTRLAAVALAGFSVLSALLFHFNLADQMQFILFFKNIAMAGGFLVLAAHGAGPLSVDGRRRG
jgi:putative oxidoreductase